MLIVLAGDFGVRYLLEREYLGIEIHRAIHVGDRDSDRVNAVNQSGLLLGRTGEEAPQPATVPRLPRRSGAGDVVERVASCLDLPAYCEFAVLS